MPDAPADTYNALGKNDQLINVSPSEGLVLVRMGNAAEESVQVSDLIVEAFHEAHTFHPGKKLAQLSRPPPSARGC